MISLKTPKKILTPSSDLVAQLKQLGLVLTADALDDLVARAATGRWSPRQLLEEIARSETEAAARRSLERRLAQARLRRFKPMADFEWNWPKKINRPLLERVLTLDFLTQGRNLILCGTAGLGKTMIAKNIAHTALFRTVSDLLADLERDSPAARRRKFRFYARPSLLVLDEVGYLAYDAHAADLLFEIVNHRYERNSIVVTTNKGFREWNTVFPNATCIAALLDRLTHHADVTLLEGDSYRMRESQMEADAAKKNSKRNAHAQRS